MGIYDTIIIGAGPAGIAAALYAARQQLNFLVISKDIGGQTNMISEVDNYLGYHYITGYELQQKFLENLKDYKINTQTGESVERVFKKGKNFLVKTDMNQYETKTVIIATGRDWKKAGIKGEKEFTGKGVSYCASCDGPMFKDKIVAVIGGGKAGLDEAIHMSKIAKKVYLLEVKKDLGGVAVMREKARSTSNIEIITEANTKEIFGHNVVEGIRYVKGGKEKTINCSGIFVKVGFTPYTDFIEGVVERNKRGEIVIDKECCTSMPGIFAAGDCTDVFEKQIIVAAGEGAKALMCASEYLCTDC